MAYRRQSAIHALVVAENFLGPRERSFPVRRKSQRTAFLVDERRIEIGLHLAYGRPDCRGADVACFRRPRNVPLAGESDEVG